MHSKRGEYQRLGVFKECQRCFRAGVPNLFETGPQERQAGRQAHTSEAVLARVAALEQRALVLALDTPLAGAISTEAPSARASASLLLGRVGLCARAPYACARSSNHMNGGHAHLLLAQMELCASATYTHPPPPCQARTPSWKHWGHCFRARQILQLSLSS